MRPRDLAVRPVMKNLSKRIHLTVIRPSSFDHLHHVAAIFLGFKMIPELNEKRRPVFVLLSTAFQAAPPLRLLLIS